MKTLLEKLCIFYKFWLHFGRLLAPFWESKCLQKSSEILDAILEAEKVDSGFLGVGRAVCAGAVGRIMEGYKNLQKRRGAEDEAKEL